MQLRDLEPQERELLLWLLGTLTQSDGRIDDAEVEELHYVGSALEIDLVPAMDEAMDRFSDVEEAMDAARYVREEARPVMREVLADLASGDGDVSDDESALLAALDTAWA